jgi:hypothetical protein
MTSSDYTPPDVRCNYQDNTTSGLRRKIADMKWSKSACDRTTDEICSKCKIGSSFRETGCAHLGGSTFIMLFFTGQWLDGVPVMERRDGGGHMHCRLLRKSGEIRDSRLFGAVADGNRFRFILTACS